MSSKIQKILLTGANGMFGQDASYLLKKEGFDVIETDTKNMDITDLKTVSDFIQNNPCDLVLHAAAYTNVDGAEENKSLAFLVNEKGTENIAKVTARLEIPVVYISTDYVFDGTKNSPYEPNDKTGPNTVYGESKLAGEIALKNLNPKYYIARTSWLYGHKGKNFVETMIKSSKEKDFLKVVDDQQGCPTWTYDLAKGIIKIIKDQKSYGTYHVCGSGETTWYGFTKKIFELQNIKTAIIPCTTEEFPRPAKRPAYSVMNNEGICENWEKSIEEYLNLRVEV